MKKIIVTSLIAIIAIFAICVICLVGCDNDKHTHAYTEQITETKYLKSEATCSNKSIYYYSCTCGTKGTQTFEYGQFNPDNHTFNQCATVPKYLKSEATCSNKSIYYYSCTCGAKGTQTFEYGQINSDNHTFNQCAIAPKYLKSEATCTDKAKYYYSCSCGETGNQVFEYGNLKGHVFKTYNVKSEATCTSDETQIATCENCTATDIKTIIGTKLPHNYLHSICVDCDYTYLNLSLKSDGTYSVSGIKNESADLQKLEIPSIYKSISVTSIAENAFSNCINLTKLVINDGITKIGKEAFKNCYSLTSVVIPSTVDTIGSYAFNSCYRLVELYNLSSLDITAGSSSYGGIGLYAIEIHNSKSDLSKIIKVNDYIFYIGDKNYLIDYKGNSNNITLPDTYNQENYEILDYAFFNKSALTQITVTNNVDKIGFSAFANCNNLIKLSVPFIGASRNQEENNYFGYIFGASSQYDNSKFLPLTLNDITLTDEKVIKESAFSKCNNIKTIILGEGLEVIEGWAFFDCESLSSISFPSTVTSIGTSALQNTALYNNNDNWEDDVLYIDNFLIKARNTVSGKYSIKQGTKIIATRAFEFCNNLTEVVIPNSVEVICGETFISCSKLEKVLIPNTVSELGDGLFGSCKALTSVSLPNNLQTIPNSLFRGCTGLQNIELPNSLKSIGGCAFYGCTGISEIIIPNNVVEIGGSAFYGCTALKTISLPTNLTAISDYMFNECTALKNITIPQSVKTIGQCAFYGCLGLTDIVIPDSVIGIGMAAFYSCSNLATATFENVNGWVLVSAFEPSTTKVELSSSDISNSSKAAEYLKTRIGYNWTRNEN